MFADEALTEARHANRRASNTNLSVHSRYSSSSASEKQRRAVELELKLQRKRREEEEAEEARLAELERQLKSERRRVKARREERLLEEEIERRSLEVDLERRSLGPARSTASLTSVLMENDALGESEATWPQRRRGEKSTREEPPSTGADAWIFEMSEHGTPERDRYRMPAWPTPFASFACSNPFNGNPREWPLFISRFKALVHDVVQNDTQRLAILSEWVSPDVRQRIATLMLAPQGYQAALKYLQRQYGDKGKMARCHFRDLLSLPACKSGEPLQRFADQLHGVVVILQQGGHQHDLKSAANMEQVVNKLPKYVRARWARHVRKRYPREMDLADLDLFLTDIVEEESIIRPLEGL